MFDAYLCTGLHQSFLIAAVSQFESCLFDTIRALLRRNPTLLKKGPKGGESEKPVDLDEFLANEKDVLIEKLIDERINQIGYLKPAEYITYLRCIIKGNVSGDCFPKFFEAKATRDVLTHANGIANVTYEEKAGGTARVSNGSALPVDQEYFQHVIRTMKQCSKAITDAIDKNFPPPKKKASKPKVVLLAVGE